MAIGKGSVVGPWTLLRHLGEGGNGVVWEATNSAGVTGALKMLHARHSRNAKRYERFRHEVTAQYRCQDIAGVLPLIDSYIPQNPTAFDPPWLVSALAIPLARELGKKLDLERTVAAFESLSKSLAEMHVRRISHRDLKPDKLFCLDGEFVIGDFGLADYPSKPPTSNE